jgi:hypothetical protein
MIKIGDLYFDDLASLNSVLAESVIKFTYWGGRRYQLQNGLNPRLDEIIEAVRRVLPQLLAKEHFSEINAFIKNVKDVEMQCFLEDKKHKNYLTLFFTQSRDYFDSQSRSNALNEIERLSQESMNNEIKNIKQFLNSDYKPDMSILQFFLADFVGGGKGNRLDNAVQFYKHYLEKYRTAFPYDQNAKKIHNLLTHYYEVPISEPLSTVTAELFQRLEKDKYVCFPGGYYNSDAGHAMFYELFLDDKNKVMFKVTNSGSGLQYHPKCAQDPSGLAREYRYRTLVFFGITLNQIKKDQYMEIILSFDRPRAPVEELKDLISFPNSTQTTVDGLYNFLFHAWGGKRHILAENPGGAQRAESCSVEALLKQVKGNYGFDSASLDSHLLMNFWIKVSALSDYLKNETQPASAFIEDAIRKISSHVSKMHVRGIDKTPFFKTWIEVASRAQEVIRQAQERETQERLAEAIKFPNSGIDLSKVEKVKYIEPEEIAVKGKSSIHYNHRLPGEAPDYSLLPQLCGTYLAPLMEESAYRLNFFRLLPNFDKFDFEKDVVLSLKDKYYERDAFFSDLAKTIQRFFYTEEIFNTLHIPDPFFADLLNGWIIVYLEAKKQAIISPAVLLEWMEGMILLTEAYASEYTFDKPESRQRFASASEYCRQEKKELLETLGPDFKPHPNYWSIWDRPVDLAWDNWLPYGMHWWEKTGGDPRDTFQVDKWKELPAMAKFAFQKASQRVQESLLQLNEIEKKETLTKEDYDIQYYSNFTKSSDFTDIYKAMFMFREKLPFVPLYDPLRKSLACLYIFADRYLQRQNSDKDGKGSGPNSFSDKKSVVLMTPWKGTFDNIKPSIVPAFYIGTRRPGIYAKESQDPEFYLPKSAKENAELQDLNQRIKTTIADERKTLPFLKNEEQSEFIAFVQKSQATRIPEYLTFCKKTIDQLALPTYQATFEHVLFGKEGGVSA